MMDSANQDDNTMLVRGSVKLVEDDAFEDQPVLTFKTEIAVRKWECFKENKNPVLALEAFSLSVGEGVYPPTEMLRWLADGFRKWHDEQGKLSMDSVLGLTVNKGQVPHFKRLLLDQRDEMLLLDMSRLTTLGATIAEAAAMIEKKLSDADWNKTRHDMNDLSAETLIAKYSSCNIRQMFSIEERPLNDPAWVSQWLSTFDVAYMPKALKSRL